MQQPPPQRRDVLATYVSPFIRWRIARDPASVQPPFEDVYEGAVFNADIAGFTGMAELYARQEASGAEEMGATLRVFFEELGGIVAAHGGSVLTFAGDAATAMWRIGNGVTPAEATRRALACCIAFRDRVGTLQLPAAPVPLQIRLSVGAGDVRAAAVGGVGGHWLPLVYGNAFEQVWQIDGHAAAGQIVASHDVVRLAESYLGVERFPHGAKVIAFRSADPISPIASVSMPANDEPALRRFVPPTVQARIDSGSVEWLAEFRHATVTFFHVYGPNREAYRDAWGLHRALVPIQEAIAAEGGCINKALVEREGLSVVAAWGVLQHSYEDNAARAVRAALAAQTRLAMIGGVASIGIATGKLFIGPAGTSEHKEYALLGDVVNVASRLAHGAGQGICCDAATRLESRSRVLFESMATTRVRGRSDAVAVYRPLTGKAAQRGREVLIGRTAECGRLRDALDAVETGGKSAVVFLEGEPGIGKSRLAAHLLSEIQQRSVQGLTGWGEPLERVTPYHAWRDIFARLLRFDTVTDRGAHRDRVLALLGTPDRQARAALTNVVLPLDFPQTSETEALKPAARARATREMLVHLFWQAARGRQVVLVLEDAHWMDSASWALAHDLAHSDGSLLIVVLVRPVHADHMPPDWRALRDAPITMRMRLECLSPSEAVALACVRLDVDALPEEIGEGIVKIAEGHPFFTEQLVFAMRDKDRVLRVEAGECHVTGSLSDIRFGHNVRALVDSRIDALTVQQQDTLKVASVFGRRFDAGNLRAVHPAVPDAAELVRQLDALVECDLLRADGAGSYQFKHAITQDAVSGWLLPSERRNLNARVASLLEEQHPADTSPVNARLAHHWREAGVTAKALACLDLAAQQALRNDANQEAAEFLDQALELCRDAGIAGDMRIARWKRQSAEAAWVMGNTGRARELVTAAMQELHRGARGDLVQLLVQAGVRLAQLTLPRRLMLAPTSECEQLLEASRIAAVAASLHSDPLNQLGAVSSGLLSHNLAYRAGSANVQTLAMLAYVTGTLKLRGMSHRYFDRMRHEAQAQNDLRPLLFGLLLEGMSLFSVGRLNEADRRLRQGLTWAGEAGNQRDRARLLLFQGVVSSFSGDMRSGLRNIEASYQFTNYGADASIERSWSLIILGGARAQHLPPQQARASYAELRVKIRESLERDASSGARPNPLRVATASALDALVHTRTGALAAAVISAREALTFFSTRNLLLIHPSTWILVQGTLEAFWNGWEESQHDDPPRADSIAADMQSLATTMARFAWLYPVYGPRALLCRGLAEWMAGREGPAHACWRRSLAAADALTQTPGETAGTALMFDRALAWWAIARHGRTPSERREGCRRALELFEACDMPAFTAPAHVLLDASEGTRMELST